MPKSNRLALLLAFGLGCGGASIEAPPAGGSLEILVPAVALRPGRAMQASVRVRASDGEGLEPARVRWRSLTPSTLQVDSAGRLLAIAPGTGVVRATSGTLAAEVTLALTNPPVRALTLDVDSLRLSLPNGTRQVTAIAHDSVGDPIIGAAIQWASAAARIADVTTIGQVTAVAVGRTRVTAQADAVTASLEVVVNADPSPTAPIITAIAPLVVIPGQTLVVNGSLFGGTVAGNTVLLDGIPLAVTQATPAQLVLAVPAATHFPCAPRRTVALQITTAGGIGVAQVPLEVATVRSFDRGAYAVLSQVGAHCLDLSTSPGRYRLAVTNVGRAIGSASIAATLTGVIGTAQAEALADAPVVSAGASHLRVIEASRAATLVAARPAPRAGTPRVVEPRLGELRPIRLPALGQPDLCATFTPITARVAWVGRRIAILEDTATVIDGVRTLAGSQDALYAMVGAELDSLGWSIVRRFGDPLVMDSRLDDDGRVAIVLTPRMNTILGGTVLAATVTCDLFPRLQFAASDMGEIIYAQAPTVASSADLPGSLARWRREMRATLVHELKHIASYAERIVRGQPLEESWLEEATARHAEELFARAIYGHLRYANIGFSTSLACEITASGCADAPRAVQPHLEGLYEMLRASTTRSLLGPTIAGDFSFYGSAWAFTRWALDQQGADESAVFAALTTGGQAGLANLEARVQRPWEELLPEWALTMMVDDAGFTVPSRLTFPSWNLRSQFRGLCEQVGQCLSASGDARFPEAEPVRAVRVTPGTTAASIGTAPPFLPLGSIVPGGFAPVELTVAPGGNGVVGLTAGGSTLRVALVRIE